MFPDYTEEHYLIALKVFRYLHAEPGLLHDRMVRARVSAQLLKISNGGV